MKKMWYVMVTQDGHGLQFTQMNTVGTRNSGAYVANVGNTCIEMRRLPRW